MTKIRKYNGVYKLPIKKHTKVRRPVSRYITYIMIGTYNVPFDLEGNSPLTLVQDIRKDLYYIIDTGNHKNITVNLGRTPKPKSLWQRIMEKFRGKL